MSNELLSGTERAAFEKWCARAGLEPDPHMWEVWVGSACQQRDHRGIRSSCVCDFDRARRRVLKAGHDSCPVHPLMRRAATPTATEGDE